MQNFPSPSESLRERKKAQVRADLERAALELALERDLDEVKVLKKSLMPENFAEVLTTRELHDLFAYLMSLE